MKKLIFETGKCKLKGFAFPVRIYATDAGPNCDQIHAAYKGNLGWNSLTWEEDGVLRNGNENFDLVPIPQSQYFNIYTDDDGIITRLGIPRNTLVSAVHVKRHLNATTCKYTDGVIEKVEEEII